MRARPLALLSLIECRSRRSGARRIGYVGVALALVAIVFLVAAWLLTAA